MQKRPIIVYLSLGDELLLGLRDNAHLTFLGGQLQRYGLMLYRNLVVRDEPAEIAEAFRDAWAEADMVITTGGLGPTVSDRTKESLSEALGRKLVYHPEVEGAIRERFTRLGRTPQESVFRQAWQIEGAELLPNAHGTAPGVWLHEDGKRLIMLPGPSHEMRPLWEEQVLPRLQREGLAAPRPTFLQIRTCGLGESAVEQALVPVVSKHSDRFRMGLCTHDGLVDVRLSMVNGHTTWEDLQRFGETCRLALGMDFVSFGDCSLALLILRQVRALGKTIAVAESCTGGLLANAFTDIPGASKVFSGGLVCYNNDAKVQLLDVPEAIIQQHGAVSAECAVAMAMGCLEKFGSDYALSVTGFAGPGGGNADNPVGTIYFGYCSPIGAWSHRVVLPGNRQAIKARAVNIALDWMRRKLIENEVEEFLECMQC